VITIRIAMLLAIALFGVLVISPMAVAPEAYASGGLMSLVAHGAQDVYKSQTSDDDALSSIVPGLDNDTKQH
jgi:hypothetical protein